MASTAAELMAEYDTSSETGDLSAVDTGGGDDENEPIQETEDTEVNEDSVDSESNDDDVEPEQDGDSPAPEDADPEDTVTEEVEPSVNEALLVRAEELGMTRTHATKLDKAGLLEESLAERASSMLDGLTRQRPEATPEAQETASEPDPLDAIKLDPDEYDEKVIANIDALKAEVKTLRLNQQTRAEIETRNQVAEVSRQFDHLIDGLGEGYHDVLGKGGLGDMDKGSDGYAARIEILQRMEVESRVQQQLGRDPSLEEVFQNALPVVLGDKSMQIARDTIVSEVKKQSNRITSKPTSRKASEGGNPLKRAAAVVNKYQREHEVHPEDGSVVDDNAYA